MALNAQLGAKGKRAASKLSDEPAGRGVATPQRRTLVLDHGPPEGKWGRDWVDQVVARKVAEKEERRRKRDERDKKKKALDKTMKRKWEELDVLYREWFEDEMEDMKEWKQQSERTSDEIMDWEMEMDRRISKKKDAFWAPEMEVRKELEAEGSDSQISCADTELDASSEEDPMWSRFTLTATRAILNNPP